MAFGNVIVGAGLSALVEIVVLMAYLLVYASFNTTIFPAGIKQLLDIIPTLLAIGILITTIVGIFAFALGGRR